MREACRKINILIGEGVARGGIGGGWEEEEGGEEEEEGGAAADDPAPRVVDCDSDSDED